MEKQIAILADQELVDAMRLAGLSRTRALRAHAGSTAAVCETLGEWLMEEEIGVIVIGADHAALASELISSVRRGKRISPVIVEVPSRDGAWRADAAQYYQTLGRKFLGLEIVLRDNESAMDETQSRTT
jgi:vacuolar-type H+-ATPase subunit F/Vma7